MAISPETIDQIRLATDIAEVVREYIPTLKKSGRNWKSVCPFHSEKTPSFMVSSEKGIFHCFGCHAGGDVFKFVSLIDNLTWPEAVNKLAARAGISVKENTEDILKRSDKQKIYDLLEDAAAFYSRCLKETSDGSLIIKYLAKRGVSDKAIEDFGLGFAPYGSLVQAALKKGYSYTQLTDAGLVTKTEKGTYFEYMSGRLVFPIKDAQGRVVAFGGRAPKDDNPKYINSPESKVYSKSMHLYGLQQAIPELRISKHIIVLEGYMDVVLTHQLGITNTVATLGTALTPQHAKLIGRYADNVTVIFDPDSAGDLATRRAIEVFIDTDLNTKIVSMPDGLDPDEYALKVKKEGFDKYLQSNSRTAIEFLVYKGLEKWGRDSTEHKIKLTQDIIPFIAKVGNEILRMEWVKYLAQETGTSEEAVLNELKKTIKAERSPRLMKNRVQPPGASQPRMKLRGVEEEILQVLFSSPELCAKLTADDFSDERNKKVFSLLSAGTAPSEISAGFKDEDSEWITELVLEERGFGSPEQVLSGLLKHKRHKDLEVKRQQLESEVNLMISGKIPLNNAKLQLYNELNKQLKGSEKI